MAGPNLHERAYQIADWLSEHFPLPHRLRLRWLPKIADPDAKYASVRAMGHCAQSYFQGRMCCIDLSKRCIDRVVVLMDVMPHEWAHLRSVKYGRLERMRPEERHDDEWALEYGRIYRAFIDAGGAEESYHYPYKRRRMKQ